MTYDSVLELVNKCLEGIQLVDGKGNEKIVFKKKDSIYSGFMPFF